MRACGFSPIPTFFRSDPQHRLTRAAIARINEHGDVVCVTSQNLIECWLVRTRPVENSGSVCRNSLIHEWDAGSDAYSGGTGVGVSSGPQLCIALNPAEFVKRYPYRPAQLVSLFVEEG